MLFRSLGVDPDTGEAVYLLFGQYGPYVQRGQVSDDNPKPRRASLPKGTKPEDLTLEAACGLLQLPRELGEHPEGGRVQAGLGRFGAYVVHDRGKGEKDYRSLKAEDDVLTVDLERALELLAMPKRGRGGRTALRTIGSHPESGEPVAVFDGPYGLYVKSGKVNASLPEGRTAESIEMPEALELLAAKTAAKGGGRRTTKTAAKPAAKGTRRPAARSTSSRSSSSVKA